FLGNRMMVHGYLGEAGGFLRLYLTAEHASMTDDASSVIIHDPKMAAILNACGSQRHASVMGQVGVISALRLPGIVAVETIDTFNTDRTPVSTSSCWPLASP